MAKEDRKKEPRPQPEQTKPEQAKPESAGAAARLVTEAAAGGEAPDLGRLPAVDIERERQQLDELSEAERAQTEQRIDRTVEEGVEALRRAEEDAQPGFQSMRDQIAIDERQALDSQALYAEMRGDRGGIGQAQYASIQNTAAVNRQKVGREQQRLATETARQIEDLRRRGDFERADAVLALTQRHLSELMELERWAQEQNLSVERFNTELARWEAEYAWQLRRYGVETELSMAQLTGTMPDGSPTLASRQAERSRLAAAARMLLEFGLTLTPEQLEALGWTEGQYEAYIQQRTGSPGPGQGTSGGGTGAGAAAEEEGTGSGAPFQMVAAWASALQGSDKPWKVWAQIQASPWFERMTDGQKQWLSRSLPAKKEKK